MPELPEVETTRRGIAPHIEGSRVLDVIVRERRLRWPVPEALPGLLAGRPIIGLSRRAKYLLFHFEHGTLIVHLGMSGTLRVLTEAFPAEKHDHIDLVLDNGRRLRYRDPRRFGAMLWHTGAPAAHPLLRALGPEPLSPAFDADHLIGAFARRHAPIKQVVMDNHVVVGVGNIYASESLFRARIDPRRPADTLNRAEIGRLVEAIRETLTAAISAGGTTLRDFVDSDGRSGYFLLQCYAYGRAGEPCRVCGTSIAQLRQGQRATFHCPDCQH
ncbi:bifunctional DNA-formamidopyrimidine glycosylase/DNA-(apurinic or apyrimidinic site) lyase [Chitiniphilus purpureus]|uniref:Formamidopyrimidine-DNA glycosylase n=1 Tax=Chitiniphilus purpureus TaxID=2981137 RepID=A0ABY6DP58_9NEIS|nr:bifunctional DNA-formamidopyrimidine glycosylase/DNA-(apurinic or apyrimidinic site) lyase [Chitiniphilus sp. CD1]UXY16165.1 bifunctional DNA-formamidopyrimidine glycosylase/DNA-(apurinic or apyrimidinic site) lyase [Chitiniphilus sp. CD1]